MHFSQYSLIKAHFSLVNVLKFRPLSCTAKRLIPAAELPCKPQKGNFSLHAQVLSTELPANRTMNYRFPTYAIKRVNKLNGKTLS